MNKVIVIGCPGAGKSTFGRKLSAATGIPLFYLDMIWHKADKTTISRDEFDARLMEIMRRSRWIIDGNYVRTLPMRLEECDTVFYFDLPREVCENGVIERLGTDRPDMPWVDTEIDEDFMEWVRNFHRDVTPLIENALKSYDRRVIKFTSRNEADDFVERQSLLTQRKNFCADPS